MLPKILLVAVAYLLGSIPFGYLLVKYVFTSGEDVRQVGSGGTGATNVARRAGAAAGLLTYVFDVAKGIAAMMLMRAIAPDDYFWTGAAAIAAVVGHMLPIFLGFRGGKGVATGVGVFVVLAPYSVVSTLVLWLIIVYFTRYVSLASIVATSAVPLWTLIYYGLLLPSQHLKGLVIIALCVCALIVGKHHENIGRLVRGTENKLGARVKPRSEPGDAAISGGKS